MNSMNPGTVRKSGPATGPGASSHPESAQAELLRHAVHALSTARTSTECEERYVEAHLAALRAAAAVISARSVPRATSATGTARRGARCSVWSLLPPLAPELTEWADFFALTARKRVLAQSVPGTVSEREADDLLRQSAQFVQIVAGLLGLPMAHPLGIAV